MNQSGLKGALEGRQSLIRSINAMLRLGFGVVFALVIFSTISSLEISARRTRLRGWVTHSYDVQAQIQHLTAALHQVEAMERDAVLRSSLRPAGSAPRLSPETVPQLPAEREKLERLTRDNPDQHARARALRTPLEERQARFDAILAACRRAPAQASARFLSEEEQSSAARTLSALAAMNREEERLLQQRLDALNRFALTSESVLLSVRLFVLVVITLVYAGVSRIAREKEDLVQRLGETNRRLETLATTDHLTGIYNQRAFHKKVEESFERELATGKTGDLSLIVLDIDRFKQYNDTYGHPAGDDVLETVGKLLKNGTRKTDFAARNGGEEFAILLPRTSAAEATRAAEGIRAMIEGNPWPLRPVTASIGVATMRPEMATADALTCAADLALYTSKRNGRNRVHHFDEFGSPDTTPLPAEEE